MKTINYAQQQACQPHLTCWVNASAGSGKTKVLIDRLLSLLLTGSEPSSILCLTYTKAAASEMIQRLYHELEKLETVSNQELIFFLQSINLDPTQENQLKARGLFQKTLSKNQFVVIQTVHAFCQKILESFSLEAGLFPSFQIMDDQKSSSLIESLFPQVLDNFEHKDSLLCLFTDGHLKKLLKNALSLNGMKKWLLEPIALFQQYYAGKGNATFNKKAYFLNEGALFDDFKEELVDVYQLLKEENLSSVTDRSFFEKLEGGIKNTFFLELFLTDAGTKRKRLLTKKVLEKHPYLEEALDRIAQSLQDKKQEYEYLIFFSKNQVFFLFLKSLFEEVEVYKKRHTYLDFEDVILKTLDLLTHPTLGASVLYSINQNLTHLLIDEAQDTNPLQWEVISLLTQEFYAQTTPKTVFAVGDPKQSIYSFQGAHPQSFLTHQKEHYKRLCEEYLYPFREINLSLSYRSSPAILDFVTKLLKTIPLFKEGLDAKNIIHQAFHENRTGFVKLLPLLEIEKSQEEEPWSLVEQDVSKAHDILAKNLVNFIKHLLSTPVLDTQTLPFLPQDIMILVRKRSDFLASLEKELKKELIPVSGLSATKLSDQLIVKDLLSVVDFVLYPYDDLALAALLKSPLIGLSEEELLSLCLIKEEKKTTLWKVLKTSFSPFPKARETLKTYLAHADRLSVYDFFSLIVLPPFVRERYVKELGKESIALIHDFLEIVLEYLKANPSNLELFKGYLSENEDSFSSFSLSPNTLRLLTVHGSKGLQAPVVIVCDACEAIQSKSELFIKHEEGWWLNPAKDLDVDFLTHQKERQLEQEMLENHRLLYVAATRAERCLYFAGVQKTQTLPEDCWYVKAQGILSEDLDPIQPWIDACNMLPEEPVSEAAVYQQNVTLSPLLPKASKAIIQTKAQKRGTDIHKIFELYHHYDDEVYPAFDGIVLETIKEQFEKQISEDESDVFTEVGFFIKTKSYAKTGRMDVLYRLKNTPTFEIVDYKTTVLEDDEKSKLELSYKSQLDFYEKALKKSYPDYFITSQLKWIRIAP